MTCQHCAKAFGDGIEYCPHCGMAAKPPTETENRDFGDTRTQKRGLKILLAFIFVYPVLEMFLSMHYKKTTLQEIGLTPLVSIALFLLLLSPFIAWNIFKMLKGRSYPLIKRNAVVLEKRREAHRRGADYYVTFRFPDEDAVEFEVGREAHNELVRGKQIILKYKEFYLHNQSTDHYHYFGYERLEEQPDE